MAIRSGVYKLRAFVEDVRRGVHVVSRKRAGTHYSYSP